MLPSSRLAVLCALILMGPSCSAVNPTASLDYMPSALPTGPLWIATWLPAGMNDFRFGEQDRAYLRISASTPCSGCSVTETIGERLKSS